jgi:2-isopropylmalate synthase
MTERVPLPPTGRYEWVDYKEWVLPAGEGTGSRVRVLVESGDHRDKEGTVGVSEGIFEASWQALLGSIACKLLKEEKKES